MKEQEKTEVEIEDFYPFVQPPQWVLFSGISPHAFKLYCVMFAHVNLSDGKSQVWPSQQTLADLMGLKKADSIPGLLDQLYAIGAVSVQRFKDGMVKRNRYTIRRKPPKGWNLPTSLSGFYEVAKEKTAGRTVPPNQGVRTPKSGGPVPPNQGVKQEPLPQQEPLKEEIPPTSVSPMSEIASRSTDVAIRRDDVETLCTLLADRIEANGSKRPNITDRWRDAARLMLDRDGRDFDRVRVAILWCQNHEFWKANVLSMPKLRERYDQLRLVAQREQAEKDTQLHGGRRNNDLGTQAHYQRYEERAVARMAEEAAGGRSADLWERAMAGALT